MISNYGPVELIRGILIIDQPVISSPYSDPVTSIIMIIVTD